MGGTTSGSELLCLVRVLWDFLRVLSPLWWGSATKQQHKGPVTWAGIDCCPLAWEPPLFFHGAQLWGTSAWWEHLSACTPKCTRCHPCWEDAQIACGLSENVWLAGRKERAGSIYTSAGFPAQPPRAAALPAGAQWGWSQPQGGFHKPALTERSCPCWWALMCCFLHSQLLVMGKHLQVNFAFLLKKSCREQPSA